VTCYALAFGSLLLVGGRIGDMFSRKWVFITGLAGFAVASAIGGAAVSFAMLVTARTLQGVFGALLAPAALGTLTSTFTDPRERGRAFAVVGAVASGGAGVGLILGGVLTQYLSWRYTLYVNLVFAAFVLASAGLFLIVFGFSRAEIAGWAAPLTVTCLVAGPLLLPSRRRLAELGTGAAGPKPGANTSIRYRSVIYRLEAQERDKLIRPGQPA